MGSRPGQLRTMASAMVVLGFVAELAAVVLLAGGRRTPAVLAAMIAGLILVIMGLILFAMSRRR